MSLSPISVVLLLLVLGGCAFAFWKGGPAERAGAGVILANLTLLWVADLVWAKIAVGLSGTMGKA